ncbi:MAG: TolC family protein, partial [Planctomycetota bacterium]
ASLDITRTRYENGAAPLLDVAQAERNLANTEAELPSFMADERDADLRLAVLTGETPSAWVDSQASAAIPVPPDRVHIGVPTNAVRQRPDVRGAERRLAGEVARLGVEIGDLYPRFVLGGSLGYEATSSGDLLERASGIFGLGPTFTWNLFDGGRERGEVREQRFAIEEALLEYRQAVLLALEEAESALFGLARARERQAVLTRAVDASRRSAELSRVLYLEGRSDFQNVLDAERSLFEAQDALIAGVSEVTQSHVALQRALGGGWQIEAVDGAPAE